MEILKEKEISTFIDDVNKEIQQRLNRSPKFMYKHIEEYVFRGGKRIRPILLYTSANMIAESTNTKPITPYEKETEPIYKSLVKIAAGIELFHNFTLIHDDIEDNSDIRRGLPTLHKILGIPIAINLGDALYTIVWETIIEALNRIKEEEKAGALEDILSRFMEVVNGQGTELEWYRSKNVYIKEEDYYSMVRGKTGALMALSCSLGARIGAKDTDDKNRYVKTMADIGMDAGTVFQIKDDILNISGDEKKYKKEIGEDISEGKRTLITIYAIRKLPPNKSERLKEILLMNTKDRGIINEALDMLKSSGGVDYAKSVVEGYINNIYKKMKEIPDGKNSKYKSIFTSIIRFLTEREL